jgi:hypothetical protein
VVNNDVNIDLLFRNRLKDYEVLPPVEVWNNILPVIRKRQRPVLLLRSAALIAVLLSISFIAYQWSQNLSISIPNPVLAMSEESVQAQDNSSEATNIRRPSASTLQRGMTTYDNISDQQPAADLSDDGNIASSYQEFITETQNLTSSDNTMIPPSIRPNRVLSYKIDNLYSGYESLNKIDYEVPKEKINRWSLTAMASPTIYLTPELSSSEISSQISSSEQSRISYTGGVGFAYKISRKFSIQSGLYYSSIGNEVAGINSFAGFREYDYTKGDHNFEVLTSSGRIYTENADVFLRDISGDRVLTRYTNDVFDPGKANLSYINSSLFQNFSYLEMPVVVRFKLIDKSIDFNLIGGFSYNLLVNNSVHTVIDGSKYNIGKTAGVNPLMVSSSLGMGMEYSLSDKFSLNLEPTIRYYLNPFGGFSSTKTHPYSFGVFSGLSYKF